MNLDRLLAVAVATVIAVELLVRDDVLWPAAAGAPDRGWTVSATIPRETRR